MNQNYYPIKPMKAKISAFLILKNPLLKNQLLECEIVGLCFYKNETITCMIKLSDGEIFRYISFSSLYWKEQLPYCYELNDLVYHDNPSDNVKISYINTLKGESFAYLVNKNQWIACEYILSIDYYKDDKMLHLVKLMNGQFAVLPFHKLKFKPIDKIEYSFKEFKKQNLKYRVGGLE